MKFIGSHQTETTISKVGLSSPSGLLPLFVLAHFGHHVLTSLTVPLLPFIRDHFALDYTQSGLLISAFSLSYGFSQLPSGWLADRVGPRIVITTGISGVALAGLLVGLSKTYTMMIVCLVLMGVAGGGYHPAVPPLISTSVGPRNRGRALGLHLAGGNASFILTPLIGVAIATAWGWRGSFIGLAVPTIILGMIFYVLFGRQREVQKEKHKALESHGEISSTRGHLRPLIAIMILSTCTQAVTFSTVSFIPLFMVDHFNVSEQTAAAFLSIMYSAGLWASPLGGHLSDRVGRIPVILVACLISGPVVYLLTLAPYGLGFGAVLLVMGMLSTTRMPVSEAYIVGQSSKGHRSTVLGIYFFAAMEGGGVLTPVMGALIERFGFYYSFAIAGATLVMVTLVCSVWLLGSRE